MMPRKRSKRICSARKERCNLDTYFFTQRLTTYDCSEEISYELVPPSCSPAMPMDHLVAGNSSTTAPGCLRWHNEHVSKPNHGSDRNSGLTTDSNNGILSNP